MVGVQYFLLIFACVFVCSNAVVEVPKVMLNDGHEMPAFALGTYLGNLHQDKAVRNLEVVEQAVIWAIEAGYRHIDTAFAYKVEDQVGKAIAKKIADGVKREDLYICTKLWNDRHARTAVVPALRASLANLDLDYVDLYLIHTPAGKFENGTYDFTDYLETWRGMIEAKNLGLTRSIGLSNFNKEMIDRILDSELETPAVLQVEINLNLQQPDLLAYCREKNITVTGYTPFGSLYQSKGGAHAPPPRANDPEMVAMANKYGKTVAQVTLRYLYELGVIPIPKSEKKSRIEQNIDIFDFQLTEDDKKVLKNFDKHYRTLPMETWRDHPYYPWKSEFPEEQKASRRINRNK